MHALGERARARVRVDVAPLGRDHGHEVRGLELVERLVDALGGVREEAFGPFDVGGCGGGVPLGAWV